MRRYNTASAAIYRPVASDKETQIVELVTPFSTNSDRPVDVQDGRWEAKPVVRVFVSADVKYN